MSGRSSAIAIIGLSCRLPGTASPDAFWRLLREGADAIGEVPEGRWEDDRPAERARLAPGTRFGGFLEQIDRFDPGFFGISPREAAAMDPQQRLMLELCWEALEDAGTVPRGLRDSQTGVFVGAISSDYADLLRRRGDGAITRHTLTGLHRGMIANRVSYTLGLRGPSLTVDTGQSSSLVAVHLACESLRRGESALALACGVHLNVSPDAAIGASRLGALSPDGRCFTFDARANGYVRGEGGGVAVLKPLPDALADGDPVYCVIRGSAVNNDGGGDGFTAPSQRAQEEVLRQAYRKAGVRRADVGYVELHGSATRLGDRVEAGALGAVLGAVRRHEDPLPVGSAKTNVGHLEGAAGIVGLLKAALCIRHREIPPSLNFERPSPEIPLDALRLRVQRDLDAWASGERPLLAGVSSFGMGGTNCHVVLDEPPAGAGGGRDRHVRHQTSTPLWEGPLPWPLSGKGARALRAQARRLAGHVDAHPDLGVADVGCSLGVARSAFDHRALVFGGDRDELLKGLAALTGGGSAANLVEGAVAGAGAGAVVFMFPGQGSQWPGMAVELLDRAPLFAERLRECDAALRGHVGWRVEDVLRGAEGAPGLERIDVVQPVLFAVMVSLAALWGACGVRPAAVIGHSQGELAAACVAGALSLEDAALVVALRSRLLAGLAGRGGMVSFAAGVAEVRSRIERLGERVSIAAVNGPSSVVVSGDREALEELLDECAAEGVRAREIAVDYAAHSVQVEAIRAELLEGCASIAPRSGEVPFYSAVTGGLLDTAGLDAGYWYRNLREPVQFERAVRGALEHGCAALVEISPHPVLTVGVRETVEDETVGVIGSLRRAQGGPERFLVALGEAWVRGVEVDWAAVFRGTGARRVALPTYAFQRERHWLGDLADEPTRALAMARAGPEEAAVPEAAAGHGELDGSPLARRLVDVPEAERGRVVLELVRAQAALVLGHRSPAAVETGRAFKELGFDSAAAVELRDRLTLVTGMRLPGTLLFDHPTPGALAGHLLEEAIGARGAAAVASPVVRVQEPVAIVGMSCRFPGGARSPEELWEIVASGADAISEFPRDRGWDLEGLYDSDPEHPVRSPTYRGGFLDDAGEFDAAFFGIGPREALAMDPQQRLLLEVSWEALEDAGIDPSSLRGGRTGVFAGTNAQDYGLLLGGSAAGGSSGGYQLTGTSASVLSGRVAYVFGFEGPAISVDTACSSSLVALHLACGSLRLGECDLALAGGVTVQCTPETFSEFGRQGNLARDGRCRSFAASAEGVGFSEGVGLVLLERLSDARRNGHRVLGLVRGSAVNQDGASNGLTAPNGSSQRRVLREALASAGLSGAQVDVVEGHGTGTTLGDPIEAHALLATYGQGREEGRPLWLGSVKSNIGHTQAAAGVAGVIKMVMALRHGVLPGTLHVDEPSREVDWASGAVSLVTERMPWGRGGEPRRAGVSSFGISGTNAHLILEEAPSVVEQAPAAQRPAPAGDGVWAGGLAPWVLSGRDGAGLRGQAERLLAHVGDRPELDAADVGFSLATARAAFRHRAVVVGAERDDLVKGIGALAAGGVAAGVVEGVANVDGGVVFVFPGQGSQWVGMGTRLLERSRVFAERVRECAEALSPLVDWSLEDVLRGERGAPGLDRVEVVQPVLFAMMVSLAGVWEACGVRPDAVIGHSQGEIAAGYVAGGLSLEDAARLVVLRAEALAGLTGRGGMVSVALGAEEVQARLADWSGRLSVAAVNGPGSVVISGEPDALRGFLGECAERGVRAREIAVGYAAHSEQVEAVREELLDGCSSISARSGEVPFYSTVTGAAMDTAALDAEYWYRNLRETVRFESATRAALADGQRAFVEVSPHPVLTVGVTETVERQRGDAVDASGVVVVGSLRRDEDAAGCFMRSVGELWVRGVGVDWARIFEGAGVERVGLPTYAFQRRRYWLDARRGAGDLAAAGLGAADHPLLGAAVGLAAGGGWLLTGRLSLDAHAWLADHAVTGVVLVPGTALLELALHAGAHVGCGGVGELTLEAPLELSGGDDVQIQVAVGEADELGRRPVDVYARPRDVAGEPRDDLAWTRHASGVLVPDGDAQGPPMLGEWARRRAEVLAGSAWPPAGSRPVDVEGLYDRLAAEGFEYGPMFQGLRACWRHGDEVFAEVELADGLHTQAESFGVHPALLDAALHGAGLAGGGGEELDGETPRLPFSFAGARLFATGASSLRVCVSKIGESAISLVAADPDGALVASIESLTSRRVPPERLGGAGRRESLFSIDWVELARGADAPRGAAERWVVLGAEEAGGLAAELGEAGMPCAGVYGDLETVGRALEAQAAAAEVVLVDWTAPGRELAARPGAAGVGDVAQAALGGALELLQQWLGDERFADCRLVFVTCGAVAAEARDDLPDLAGAPLWGLVRSAQSEHPGRFALIDVDWRDDSWGALPAALAAASGAEPQLAVRAGAVLAARLARGFGGALASPPGVAEWRLDAGDGGTFEALRLVGCPQAGEPLGEGQVRVAMRAAGLNFRDVMTALGVVPRRGEWDMIGNEGAGVVLDVGAGVEGLVVGDRVMGLFVGGFGPVAVTDRRLIARMPAGWSFAMAASVSLVFLTAYHGLVDLAGVRRGERLLVHAAAGGVGMAAVQLARHLGVEVFATASPGKWDALGSLGLDRAHIASSRDLGFGERFLQETGGGGVDVVLNSLAGKFVDASLGLLAPGGRFIEMGKTDIRDAEEVGRRHPGVGYRAFDLFEAGPERIREMLSEILGLFEEGVLRALPVRTWDLRRARDAFRFVGQARHVGKVVLTLPPSTVDPERTVLITGGTGGLGGLLARHLVGTHGARHVVLASRGGRDARGAGELEAELAAMGARVTLVACDVGDRTQLAGLIESLPAGHPLGIVVHAAGALDDAVIESLTGAQLRRVWVAKAAAAWHLHELTAELDLDAFVLFSSAAATLGNAGQGNYAAANAFLDALATHRRARGLVATSIAWGFWAQATGLTGALRDDDVERMARGGIGALSNEEGLELFDAACAGSEALVVAARLDRGALRDQARIGVIPPLLGGLVAAAPRGAPGAGGSLARRLAAASGGEREQLVLRDVLAHAAAVLGHGSPEAIDAQRAFKELGFDSLASVELRNRLAAASGLRLPSSLIFDHPTPVDLARRLLGQIMGERAPAVSAPRAPLAVDEPIAIVGMSCRYPGGIGSPEQLWQLVSSGADAISPFPTDRGWDLERLYDPDRARPGTSYVREGGFVHDAGEFDSAFFGIGPREALGMDPQQRLLLEASWEALEDAAIDPATLRASQTGVFAGAMHSDYAAGPQANAAELEGYLGTGGAGSVLSGRVAYTFGFEGPAVTIDTACSSSLVALHLACGSLRAGECTLALAGGVTVLARADEFARFSLQRNLARDGRCKPFADGADGTGLAEGVGVMALERLSDAQRNGHRILAVIRGSAINQDGASNGLTAPNGASQQQLILRALANAGLSPDEVDAVEAHGTGTTLGDPIEAQALLATYGRNRDADSPLRLGSIKSNIGHTQAAAGVAGVIKMAMALRHETLPRTLHVREPTKEVDWSTGAVTLLSASQPWVANGRPRRAGVSAFGISGTNAHLILEEAPPVARTAPDGARTTPDDDAGAPARDTVPWIVSAKSAGALRAQAGRLRAFAADTPEAGMADIGLSLAGRPVFEHRAVVLGGDRERLVGGAAALAADAPAGSVARGVAGAGGVAFLFTGQGAQRVGMGRELHGAFPVFREALEEVCAHMDGLLGGSLREVMFGEGEAVGEPAAAGGRGLLDETLFTQTALFALEVALFRLVVSWGVRADFVMGHSIGELVAAHVAGVFSLEDACRLVAARGRLMGDLPAGGAMVTVGAAESEALESLAGFEGRVALAAVNGPSSVVLSGDEDAVLELAGVWEGRGRRTRRLRVSHAFHSSRMDGMLDGLEAVAREVSIRAPAIPIVSNLTGGVVDIEELRSPRYWARHVREPVRFADGVRGLAARGVRSFLELGPDGVLSALARECLADGDPAAGKGEDEAPVTAVGLLRAGRPEGEALVEALARCWVHGVDVDWAATFGGTGARRLSLPTYAFQRERYWLEPTRAAGGDVAPSPGADIVEGGFWEAVEREDADALADALGVDGGRQRSSLGTVLPALAAWRRGRVERSTVDRWRYRVRWQPVGETPATTLAGVWLLAVPARIADGSLAAELARALEGRGARVALLGVDAASEDRGALARRLRELLADGPPLGETGGGPVLGGVLSLLALDEAPERESVPRGLAGSLALVQALGDAGIEGRLWVLTRGAVSMGSGDRIESPSQQMVWGLGRVLRLEDPGRWGGLVDLPVELDERSLDRLCGVLAGVDGEDEVAVRSAGVFARRLVRARRGARGAERAWRPRGTMLVTGGTGALGGHVARWLARGGAEHIVLASRRGRGAAGAARLGDELGELGARVTVASCDVADRGQLERLLAAVPDGSPLSGVFHVAGVLDDELLDALTLEQVERVLRPKADAAWHLHELTAELDLDAFVLFSSLTATLGGGGQGNYAAGNAFLDALAGYRRARGLTATTVAWGPWMGEGMAAGVGERMRGRGVRELPVEHAIAALQQALDDDETHIAVADLDWERYAPMLVSTRSCPAIGELPEVRRLLRARADEQRAAGGNGSLADRLVGMPEGERQRAALELVRVEAAAVLGHRSPDAVHSRRAFRELGFDSLAGVELRNRLDALTGLRLASTLVFDHPTPAELVEYLLGELGGAETKVSAPISTTVSVGVGAADEPVAIVGMGCRYPGGVGSPQDLWELLVAGGDAISAFPADRGWNLEAIYDPDPEHTGTSYACEGGFLDDAAQFDAAFFGIGPREALAMEPSAAAAAGGLLGDAGGSGHRSVLAARQSDGGVRRNQLLRLRHRPVRVGRRGRQGLSRDGHGRKRRVGTGRLHVRAGGAGGDGGHGVLLLARGAAPGLRGAARGRVHAGAGRGRDGDGHAGRLRGPESPARSRARWAVQAVRERGGRHRLGRGRGRAAAGAALGCSAQRPPGAGGGARQRRQPGWGQQRIDGAERSLAAAGHPAGARRSPGSAAPMWTSSRRTARAPGWATRSRRRRCWPPTVANGRRTVRCGWGRSSRTSATRRRRPVWRA